MIAEIETVPTTKLELISPQWPAAKHIHALTTTRRGGVSESIYDSLNIATFVDDDLEHVNLNRQRLHHFLDLPNDPVWLKQVHGNKVICANDFNSAENIEIAADAAYATKPGIVCVVQTADCLPILLCDRQGTKVAAIHAGWRSLGLDIIHNTVNALNIDPADLLAWLGPAIGPKVFEVGTEVRELLLQHHPEAEDAFAALGHGKWLADIYQLARQRLANAGVPTAAIYGGNFCTFTDKERFFSYRRDGKTGRMASLIWIGRENDEGVGYAG